MLQNIRAGRGDSLDTLCALLGIGDDESKTRFLAFISPRIAGINNFNEFLNTIESFEGDLERRSSTSFSQDDEPDLYLVYVGPSNSSGSSMFGHLFLLKASSEFSLSDTYAYMAAASPAEDGFFKYAINGINGGYSGRVVKEPLYKALRRYSELEDRTIYFYQIAPGHLRTSDLLTNLQSQVSRATPYKFFSNNCTSYLRRLFHYSGAEEVSPWLALDYPSKLVMQLEEAGIAKLKMAWPSSYSSFIGVLRASSAVDRAEAKHCLKKIRQTSSETCSLSRGSSSLLSSYYFLEISKFERIEFLNSVSRNSDFTSRPVTESAEISMLKPARLGLISTDRQMTLLSLRPAYHDELDPQTEPYNFDALEIATVEAEATVSSAKLSRFMLFRSKVIRDFNAFSPDLSFELSLAEFRNSLLDSHRPYVVNAVAVGISRLSGRWQGSLFFKPKLYLGEVKAVSADMALEAEGALGSRFKVGLILDRALYQTRSAVVESAQLNTTARVQSDLFAVFGFSYRRNAEEPSQRMLSLGLNYSL